MKGEPVQMYPYVPFAHKIGDKALASWLSPSTTKTSLTGQSSGNGVNKTSDPRTKHLLLSTALALTEISHQDGGKLLM